MDPAIVAALIGAAVTGIGWIVEFIRRRSAQKARREAEDARRRTEQAVTEVGRQWGGAREASAYYLERQELLVRFDDAGNVRQERRWIGLRAMQEIQNLKVQFRSSSGAPGATITTVAAKEIDGPLAASVARVHNVGGISEGLVLLSGHCGPDTPPTSFVVWHEGRSFYCLDRETAQKEYADDDWKQEYQSMAISVPTQRAVVTIDFPPSHHAMEPGPSPVVFIAHTETLHVAETKRVKPGFSWSAGRATLSVDEPKIGLGYGITWMPPAKGAGGN